MDPTNAPSGLEIAHVLMMDIVGYSRLPMDEQRAQVDELTRLVRDTGEFARADEARQLICLPTGDGMALVFLADPEAPVRCAIEVARLLAKGTDLELRMGIHSGPVYRVEDINANLNVSGGGINICQRVMDCGDAGHILVSSTAKELLGQIREWDLKPLGEHAVKHGLCISLFSLCSGGVGNPETPAKLAAVAAPSTSEASQPKVAPTRAPRREAEPEAAKQELALPDGCVWVGGPPDEECPHHDADAYAEWAARRPPITIRNENSAVELVWVPGARFTMGSNRGRDDEKPSRNLTVTGFWIGQVQVTVRQWQRVMETAPEGLNDQGLVHPVVGVTWDECREFCRRSGLALLPEGYWEYAARGREGRVYPWGSRWDPALCRCAEDSHGREGPVPAGSLPENASWCGALDMAGNVWEWCRDWYYPTLKPPPDAAPSGRRVLRGGAWSSDATECRCSCRHKSAPDNRSPLIGVRVARPVAE